MTFRDELEKIESEIVLKVLDHSNNRMPGEAQMYKMYIEEAITSIINLVDKDIIGSNIESDHQMSHRQGKAIQRNKLNKKVSNIEEK